jgi:nucleoside-diphosphate kinase
MNKPVKEKTLVLIKPDGMQRGLSGEILRRFERAGLKIVGMKLVQASRDQADQHYQATPEDLERMGNNTLRDAKEKDIDVQAELGTDDPQELGKLIKQWLVDYLSSAPILAFVLEGYGAIKIVRKITGATLPSEALPGTIRGDFSLDNPELANFYKRPLKNIIHASGKVSEAEFEINLWFDQAELLHYTRVDEEVITGPIS